MRFKKNWVVPLLDGYFNMIMKFARFAHRCNGAGNIIGRHKERSEDQTAAAYLGKHIIGVKAAEDKYKYSQGSYVCHRNLPADDFLYDQVDAADQKCDHRNLTDGSGNPSYNHSGQIHASPCPHGG